MNAFAERFAGSADHETSAAVAPRGLTIELFGDDIGVATVLTESVEVAPASDARLLELVDVVDEKVAVCSIVFLTAS